MKWAFFLIGFVIGALGGIIGYISWQIHSRVEVSHQIIFPSKVFFDNNQEPFGTVIISGTLVLENAAEVPEGERMAYPNNTYRVYCSEQYNTCFVSYAEQIGNEQIGSIESDTFPIIKWDATEIVAQEPNVFQCRQTTITISRRSKNLLWHETPLNQTKPDCKEASTSITKYTIEDSPRWKDMKQRQVRN